MPTRRLFIPMLTTGRVVLDADESHHARDVLRLAVGDGVELFDARGMVGPARIVVLHPAVTCDVLDAHGSLDHPWVHVASAVPKGDRADWLVEKLSEVGVKTWTPLRTERSIVHPEGTSKFDRWRRMAVEAAKQSRRSGVLSIQPMIDLAELQIDRHRAFLLSTRDSAEPLSQLLRSANRDDPFTLLIGPEGGWTDGEINLLTARGATQASLTDTILRIETAAVVAAAIAVTSLAETSS